MLKTFNPPNMVQPASRYVQGVEVGPDARWLYLSGQIGVAADGSIAQGLEAQFEQTFANIGTVLAAAGMGKTDIVKLTVFVTEPGAETLGVYRRTRDKWIAFTSKSNTVGCCTGRSAGCAPRMILSI